MTRDEIALKLIIAELEHPNRTVSLSNPIALMWTTFPPPGIYVTIENALWIADKLLGKEKDDDLHSGR
jgi:hypothetical protein